MPQQEAFIKIEEKLSELEPRIQKLEDDYGRDIRAILELLKKIEIRVAGGGLETNEIGLITEVRDIKKEIIAHKSQLDDIEKNVNEIKDSLPKNKQLIDDIETLKKQMKEVVQYKYMVWGGFLTVGWMIMHYSGLFEIIKHGIK